jgi:hypothetical protein
MLCEHVFVMAHAPYLCEKARSLRVERRLTLDELAERLALPRTTIYYWVCDLPISGSGSGGGWPEAARRKGNRVMRRKYRLLREEAYREGEREFDLLAEEPTFRDFVCLYIAEGSKRNRNRVALCNSDVAVIHVATSWMRRMTDKPLKFAIQHHADRDLHELGRFWAGELDIEPSAIGLLRKSNSSQLGAESGARATG